MNKMDIKIGVTGEILTGRHQGWFIQVEDDRENTGGYYILVFNNADEKKSSEGYDRWAEDLPTLYEMFKEARWQIKWIE
jgi:hypothetical protein